MSDLRTQLDQEIGDAPPSRLDIDAVIGRERRRARRLRAGAGGAAAMAVAGLVAGVVGLTSVTAGTADGGADPAASAGAAPQDRPGQSCPSGRPAAVPPPDVAEGRVAAQVDRVGMLWVHARAGARQEPLPVGAGPRLTIALRAAVRAAAGTPRLTGSEWGSVPQPLVFNAGPCDRLYPGQYLATATVRNATGARIGDLSVGLSYNFVSPEPKSGARAACDWPKAAWDKPDLACVERTGPRGETVVAATWRGKRLGEPLPGATEHDITVVRGDGTVVQVTAGGAGSRTSAPFTVDQLIAIGLDPGLILTR
jgi:hypothetical protein